MADLDYLSKGGENTDLLGDLITVGDDDIATIFTPVSAITDKLVNNGSLNSNNNVQYIAFTLENSARLSLNFTSNAAIEAAIYKLNDISEDGLTYQLEKLQTINISGSGHNFTGTSTKKGLPQDTYFIGVKTVDSSANATYSISLNKSESMFFPLLSSNDDWDDVTKNGPNGKVDNASIGVITQDRDILVEGSVGHDDPVDYYEINMETGGWLSLNVESTESVKVTLYTLFKSTKNNVVTYSLLPYAYGTTSKIGSTYTGKTTPTLLSAKMYYIGVESNASVNANYTISLNKNNSEIFPAASENDDWNDVNTNGPNGKVDNTTIGTVNHTSDILVEGWVGYGDKHDYLAFTLTSDTTLSLDFHATNYATATIFKLNKRTAANGTVSYARVALQTTKLNSLSNTTFESKGTSTPLQLAAGTYYLDISSTNANNGVSCFYTVKVNKKKSVFTITDVEGPAIAINANTEAPTNENVTLTATFTDESGINNQEYSLDNETWIAYTAPIEVTENGTVYFRATDTLGNSSEASHIVANIDRTAPAIVITPSTEELTDKVTLTATFTEDSDIQKQEYKLGNGEWTAYTGPIEVAENCTVYFRATDTAGNSSEVASYTVANIDILGPEIAINPSTTESTTDPLTLTVTFTDVSGVKADSQKYSLDNETWIPYTAPIEVAENGTVYFKAEDSLGNTSSKEYKVQNFGAPVIEVTPDNVSTPAKEVKLSANFTDDDGIDKKEYRLDNETWIDYDDEKGITVTDNGIVYFRAADALGNVALCTFEVNNIDNIPPTISVSANETDFTEGNIILIVTSESQDIASIMYSQDENDWNVYPNDGLEVSENGIYYFKAMDAVGNESDSEQFAVSNIDKENPNAPENLTVINGTEVSLSWDASSDNGASGIAGYWFRYASSNEELANAEQTWVEVNSVVLPDLDAGFWYCQAMAQDRAGNLSDWSETLEFNAGFREDDVITSVGIPALGTIGHDGNYNDVFQLNLDFSGFYAITGDFDKLNGSIALTNGKKSVAKGTIKNGTLTFNSNKAVLLDGDTKYTITIKNSDKGKTASDYSFTITATAIFDNADNTDDWTDFKTNGAGGEVDKKTLGTLTEDEKGVMLVDNGWVGYGDSVDYMAFTLDFAAKLSFSFNATDATKVFIYKLNESKGTYSLKTLQTTILKLSKNKEYNASSTALLLDKGQYFIGIISTNASKGGNSAYSISLNENSVFYTQGNKQDDDAWGTSPDLVLGEEDNDWVGFGDANDYRQFTTDENGGIFSFGISDVENNVKLALYSVNNGKLKNVKSVSATAKTGAAEIKDVCLAKNTQYVLAITATNASKAQNSKYTLTSSQNASFNWNNNSWETAAQLELDDELQACLTNANIGDKVDFYNLSDLEDDISLEMTSGKLKVSFYDANHKAVKTMVTYANETSKSISSMTLACGNATTGSIVLSDISDNVKYMKLEAASSGNNSCNIGIIA